MSPDRGELSRLFVPLVLVLDARSGFDYEEDDEDDFLVAARDGVSIHINGSRHEGRNALEVCETNPPFSANRIGNNLYPHG